MSAQVTSPLAPLREPAFSSCWVGGTLAHTANWMQSIAVPILVYELTGSGAWLGIASVASQGPAILASPLGGLWADRYDKRVLLMATLFVKAAVATTFYFLYLAQSLSPPLMVTLLAIAGFASTLNIAVWQPFVAEVVPATHIGAAYRLNAIQFNASRALGPALAGVVIGKLGMESAFLINAWAYAPLAITLLIVRPRRVLAEATGSLVLQMREAARAVVGDRRLWMPALVVTVSSTLGQGLYQLMAGIGAEIFSVDAEGVGILMSSVGVFSLMASMLIIWIGDRVPRSQLIRIGFGVYVTGLVVLAATDVFWVGVIGLGITGVAHVLVHVSATTAVQIHVDDRLRGRVTSIYLMGIIVGIPIGAQLGGLVADLAGFRVVILVAAAGLGLFGLASQRFLGGLRDIDPEPASG